MDRIDKIQKLLGVFERYSEALENRRKNTGGYIRKGAEFQLDEVIERLQYAFDTIHARQQIEKEKEK